MRRGRRHAGVQIGGRVRKGGRQIDVNYFDTHNPVFQEEVSGAK